MISVLTDPIFRVRKLDGTSARVGLKELIQNAHAYSDLLGRTPTGRCAVMRLCIAFLEDMIRPEDPDARRDLFEEGKFDSTLLDRYIAECEKDGPRFLLDDPKHPFMQMPFDSELDAKAEKPIAALVMDFASGNNHIHLDHRMETEHELDAVDAFEAMLETYLFCPAGTAGPSNINNTPPVYFLIRGRNLFETLVLNMVSAGDGEELQNVPFGADLVPWRNSTVIRPRDTVAEMEFLRAFTWQPRRVTVNFNEEGKARTCYLQPGLDFRGDGRWRDPHVAAFRKKDDTWGILRPETGRQIWRNVGNLLAGKRESLIRPVTVANCSSIWENREDSVVQIEAIGLQTNQAACLGWTQETLRLPEAFLQDAEKADAFRNCVNICEEIVGKMASTISKELDRQTSEQTCAQFLQQMHDELFDRTMDRILNWEEGWQTAFADAVQKSVKDVLNQVVNRSGFSVEMLKAQGRAAGYLMGFVNKTLKGW